MNPIDLATKLAQLRGTHIVTPDSQLLLREVQNEIFPSNSNSLVSPVGNNNPSNHSIPGTPASSDTVSKVTNHNSINVAPSSKLAELLAKAREAKAITPLVTTESITNTLTNNTEPSVATIQDKYGNTITYNERQLEFMNVVRDGASAILIGAAGTGKTTCMKGAVLSLVQSGHAGIMEDDGHKYLKGGGPGVVAVSFTRRAVSNLRKAMSDDMKPHCLTIHALLEYEPQYFTTTDPSTMEEKNTMRFCPTRDANNPLSHSIRVCIIDESSMVSTDLFKELRDALPQNCQFIFLGDIQQLPPVFGSAILGYKMLELKTVELTEVYRQALQSPIIRLAHRILSGVSIPASEYQEWNFKDQLKLHPWKKKLAPETALITIAKFLTTGIDQGIYDPEEDMVLIPFNKSCGTIELNRHIAQHLARKHGRTTYEIIAGFNKLYMSPGDKVLYDKEDAVIISIESNRLYTGTLPQAASSTLDYWGYDSGTDASGTQYTDSDDVDFLLSAAVGSSGEDEDRVRKASHVVTVRIIETGHELKLDSAADLNNLLMSYALTVHKSQGSEFRKVFLMLHQSHATMIQRELLYTAVTRAREELYVICEPETFTNGINSQRIKGNTLAEKAEYFKGKVTEKERML